MKTELMAAITQLSAERNLPKEVILAALESALISAYKKDTGSSDQDVTVRIDPAAGKIAFYVQKVVVHRVTNPSREISLREARKIRDTAQIGDVITVECTPPNVGRIAAQTARQVVLQKLREAEHRAIYEEFTTKEGELVSGVIQFIEPKRIYVRLNKTEAVLPSSEQVRAERYYRGQRLRFYLLGISKGDKGPQIIVSRSHPNLIRRLFELEIPEIQNGVVEIKAIAREAGYRTKVAVATTQENIDPVGCCLGPRGIRLQSIIDELNGEKIDVIRWDRDPAEFIRNALSPAKVADIRIDKEENVATVIVPDKQLSLAIGKEGQNARLAAKLTGWRIDIKSVSAMEKEKTILQKPKLEEPSVATEPTEITSPPVVEEKQPPEAEKFIPPEEREEELAEVVTAAAEAPTASEERTIRFAEDVLLGAFRTEERDKEKSKAKGKVKGAKHRKQKEFLWDEELEE
jgi:N utilization substance protein A